MCTASRRGDHDELTEELCLDKVLLATASTATLLHSKLQGRLSVLLALTTTKSHLGSIYVSAALIAKVNTHTHKLNLIKPAPQLYAPGYIGPVQMICTGFR